MNKVKLYGTLTKADKQPDGTLIVKGIASSEAVDGDGETIKASAIKAAIPDYMRFGAVREMHQPIAAGLALKCEVKRDGKTHIEARIVDPVTIKKVESGVLQGFSIGGKVTDRDNLNKTVITGIRLTEISLVDRPCNPEAVINLCKVEDDEDKDKDKDKAEDTASDEDKDKDGGDDSKDDEDKDKDKDEDEDEDAEKFTKLSIAHDTALSKILALETTLAKVQGELNILKKKAAPPKGSIKAISKGQDVAGQDTETDLAKQAAAIDALPPMEKAMTLIKQIHGGQ